MKCIRKIITIFVIAITCIAVWQHIQIGVLRSERERYQANTKVLLSDIKRYKTRDSLNAAKAEVLTLKISELERYRADAAETIKRLNIKRNELEQVTAIQMRTIAQMQGKVRDTIIYRDRVIPDTMQTLKISNDWVDLHGIIEHGNFDGTLEIRDSLLIVESIKRCRFLGFLWKTKKIKRHSVDVTSKNPYTEIVGVESIIIEK